MGGGRSSNELIRFAGLNWTSRRESFARTGKHSGYRNSHFRFF